MAADTTAPASVLIDQPGQHGLVAHSDGGSAFVPVQTRSERFTSTSPDDFAAVTGREFEWKFVPLDAIRHLTADAVDGSPTAFSYTETGGASVDWIDRGSPLVGSAGAPEERASANAWATAEKALHIKVTGE
ncbi:MAG: hypothetical protein Q7T71_02945, partial [Herbiconiux sp.]|nr:hypothetical protein [Herbiconiux sp.]